MVELCTGEGGDAICNDGNGQRTSESATCMGA